MGSEILSPTRLTYTIVDTKHEEGFLLLLLLFIFPRQPFFFNAKNLHYNLDTFFKLSKHNLSA